MGFEYPENGIVPIVTIQKRMNPYFVNYILKNNFCGGDLEKEFVQSPYEEKMLGRTAAFKWWKKADELYNDILTVSRNDMDYIVVVVKVKLTQDLLYGSYQGTEVVAGKHIEFLEITN